MSASVIVAASRVDFGEEPKIIFVKPCSFANWTFAGVNGPSTPRRGLHSRRAVSRPATVVATAREPINVRLVIGTSLLEPTRPKSRSGGLRGIQEQSDTSVESPS